MSGAWIEIKRTSQFMNFLRAIDIFIDGEKSGSVRNGENKLFETSPGMHRVYAQVDWCKTRELEIEISAGGTTVLDCGSDAVGFSKLLTVRYLPYDEWIYLRQRGLGP